LRLVARDSLVATPWKNGGGVTRQIACFPEGSDIGSFEWRISTAEVAQDGPFSRFEGVDRRLYILEGAGLALRRGARTERLLAGEHLDFPGEAEVYGSLIGGAVTDLNIMVRRARQRMHVEPAAIDGTRVLDVPWPGAALFVVSGAVHAKGFAAPARRHDTLLAGPGDGSFTVSGRAALLLIGFEPVGRGG
jgi:uncharacterized protein